MEKRVQLQEYCVNTLLINQSDYSENSIVMVFLHEALGSIAQWKSFPQNCCDRLNCAGIIIERRGHGKSDPMVAKRDQHYLHHYAKETEQVLQALYSIHQRFLLIGHSDGASIALIMAAHHFKGIIGIVSMAAHTFVEAETIRGIDPAIEAFECGKLAGLARIHGTKTTDLFYAWANTWRADFFRNWDIREEIKSIQIPILAIQGTTDQYGTVAQLNSIKNVATPVELVEVPCGHHPHLALPMEIMLRIQAWFKFHFRA